MSNTKRRYIGPVENTAGMYTATGIDGLLQSLIGTIPTIDGMGRIYKYTTLGGVEYFFTAPVVIATIESFFKSMRSARDNQANLYKQHQMALEDFLFKCIADSHGMRELVDMIRAAEQGEHINYSNGYGAGYAQGARDTKDRLMVGMKEVFRSHE